VDDRLGEGVKIVVTDAGEQPRRERDAVVHADVGQAGAAVLGDKTSSAAFHLFPS
jgi:hypothetical protein